MKNDKFIGVMAAIGVLVAAVGVAQAQRRGGARVAAAPAPRSAAAPRTLGFHVVPQWQHPVDAHTNPPQQVAYHNAATGRDERHAVVVDHRPPHIVDHDAHLRVTARGYHPRHSWAHFHMAAHGWWRVWGITTWNNVGTVSCEAANETTGELYPVSEDRDATGWDDDTVNTILDQALDDCEAEANGASCVPATPSCSFQPN